MDSEINKSFKLRKGASFQSSLLRFFLGLACALIPAVSVAQDKNDLIYLPYRDAVIGMQEKEAKDLKKIFVDYKVLDLQKSHLSDLQKWMDNLNDRLTGAIEKSGVNYPSYRTYVLASEEPTAFIYKFLPAGQKVYQGHVFISSGMINKFLENMGKDIKDLNKSEMDRLLQGITGVMAHEYSHPKQDELVKWGWREAQNGSRQNHGQIDEISTDLMSIKTLKAAELEPESMLTGLQLLYGDEAPGGNFVRRATSGGASSHPEEDIRLNIVRGGLSKDRMEEGKSIAKPIEYPLEGLREDLKRTLSFANIDNRLNIEISNKAGSAFSNTVNSLLEQLTDPRHKSANDKLVLGYLDLIQKNSVGKHLTETEINDFQKLFSYMLGDGRVKFFNGPSQNWVHWASSGGGAVPGMNVADPERVRMYQKTLSKMSVLQDPRFNHWLDGKLKNDFYGTLSYLENGNYEFIPMLFTKEKLTQIYSHGLDLAVHESPKKAMQHLLTMTYGAEAAGLSVDLQADLQKRTHDLYSSSQDAKDLYLSEGRNLNDSNAVVAQAKWLNERFSQEATSNPKGTKRLLNESASLYEELLKDPETFFYFENAKKESYPIITWKNDPETNLTKIKKNFNLKAQNTYELFEKAITGEKWKEETSKVLKDNEYSIQKLKTLGLMVVDPDMPFTDEQRIKLFLSLLKENDGPATAKNLELFNKLFGSLIHQNPTCNPKVAAAFIKDLSKGTGKSVTELLKGADWFVTPFQTYPTKYLTFLHQLQEDHSIDQSIFHEGVERALLIKNKENVNYLLSKASKQDVYDLFDLHRSRNTNGTQFLDQMIDQFKIKHANRATFPSDANQLKEELLVADEIGLDVLPSYESAMSKVSGGLKSDFLKEFGLDLKMPKLEYEKKFNEQFEAISNYYQKLFNPDGIPVPVHLKSQAKYDGVAKLASDFVDFIPQSGLTTEQYYKLWADMSGKKASRYSDRIFKDHLYKHIDDLKPAEIKNILEHGMLQSEHYKVSLFEKHAKSEFDRLASMKGAIPDPEMRSFTNTLNRYVPSTSKYKDQYLEKMAWGFEADERAVQKFIEPLKSFNFKAVDPAMMNMLSVVSVSVEKLPVNEKISFLKYILDPKGDLLKAVPSLGKATTPIAAFIRAQTGEYTTEERVREMFDKLETFIGDASESERLMLNEMLVGTRAPHGLWYGNQKTLEQVYSLAGLNEEKLKLFKAYSAALPSHERSLMLSYLLASKPEIGDGGSQLLKILELHNGPGIKFAQMASILNTFGDEESKKLAIAKDSSSPPTRAEIYERLRKVYAPEEFATIKSVKGLAGSGGIKDVIFVEFKDGSTEAVYIKRKSLNNTIQSTLDIVEDFTTNLKALPDYKDAYDYDYYLTSLRKQLGDETKFMRELELSKTMGKMYSRVSPHKGWKFEAVKPSSIRSQSEELLHFKAVQGAVPFEKLGAADKKIASELILNTELDFLLKKGVFDADRHLGNFLFDPIRKTIYPIDFSQVYSLSKNGLLKPGDPYHLANIFYGISDENKSKGAKTLADTFLKIAENPPKDAKTAEHLSAAIESVLKNDEPAMKKMLSLLSKLTEERVYLPTKYSLGIIKGFSIISNEDYSKYVPEGFVEQKIRSFVRSELVLGSRYKLLPKAECINNFVGELRLLFGKQAGH